MMEFDCRTQLVELGASLFMRGYSVGGAGNISMLLPDDTLLVTPTNSCLGRLSAQKLAVVDRAGRHISGDAPTKELPMHLAVYKSRRECMAIVHLHSTYITALSCLEDIDRHNALQPFTPYYVMRIGKLPVVKYCKPGSKELTAEAGKAAVVANAFLLANHGSVVCGTSLVDAVNNAEELEETAKLYFLLLSSNRPIRYLTENEIAGLVR